jgi:hypothetical protein
VKLALVLVPLLAAAQPSNERLVKWLDRAAQKQLDERAEAIAAIRTPQQAEARRKHVRAKLLELLGGLPEQRGPLNARTTWTKDRGRYIIEGITYESLPGYVVTANLYRPKLPGRYPAVLFPLGHWEIGKPAAQRIAANLALKGFVVLAFDPVGQGERLQAFDARLGRSLIGGATEQHFMNGAQAVLAGHNVARYFIWDGMRGIDYLVSRPDVDAERIGCSGCSGGGTQTTYISALDDRVKAAAPACYMQSFRLLFTGPVGDSEQSFPNFISSGLDQTDYVQLFSPKPWLIASTEQDFFTPAAAKLVYDEAQAWYRMLDYEDRVKWVVGPGPHGTPLVVREAIYEWMIRWLKGGDGSAAEEAVELVPDLELRVTPSGQAGGRELYDIIRANITATSKIPPLPVDPYETDEALIEHPGDTAVVVVEIGALPGARAKAIAEQGVTVLALNPRGLPVNPNPRYSGDWISNERAWLVGKNLPLLRASDIATAARKLRARPGIQRVMVHAQGVAGWWAIYALANEPAIDRIWIDRTPHSIRAALDVPVHQDLHDVVIPGVIPEAAPGEKILWTDPTDWMRNVVKLEGGYVYRNVNAEDDQRIFTTFLGRSAPSAVRIR